MSATAHETSLFDRCRHALGILGIGNDSEDAQDLLKALAYEGQSIDLSAHGAWVKMIEGICHKIERIHFEKTRKAAICKHVGIVGERQEFAARVVFTKTFPADPENEDPAKARMFESYLTILNDVDGNVLKYWNRVNLPAPTDEDPKAKRPAEKGERVQFCAMVAQHGEYQGIKDTLIQRVTKAKLLT